MAEPNQEKTAAYFPEIPTDLPENVPSYPGKNLPRAYKPAAPSRDVTHGLLEGTRSFASEVNFDPVTTLNLPDKNVYVRPVKNLKSRDITPLPLNGPLSLPSKGEKIFDLSADFQRQIEARLSYIMNQYETKSNPNLPDLAPPPNLSPETPSPAETAPAAAQPGQAVQRPVISPEISAAAQVPQRALETPPAQPQSPVPYQSANRLPSDQEALLDILTRLERQIRELEIQKNAAQARVVELTNKYQSQILALAKNQEGFSSVIEQLKNQLVEEQKKKLAGDAMVNTIKTESQVEIQRLKIERDSLLSQLKEAQTKISDLQQTASKFPVSEIQVSELKARLAQVERERSDSEEKIMKLQSLVDDLRTGSRVAEEERHVITAQAVPVESLTTAKIVSPAPAFGKMAPPLTTIPNVVNGIIKDRAGLLLTDVIIVVKDEASNPVRALKSNKIGQFAISTPLPTGTYTMELEKEGQEFDLVQIKLEGKVMPPVEIKSR